MYKAAGGGGRKTNLLLQFHWQRWYAWIIPFQN